MQAATFQTRKLRELRSQARHAATEAARRKAETYCAAASVQLGKPIHIEDVDPDQVTRRGYGHAVDVDLSADSEEDPSAYDPGAIRVAGAVLVTYGLCELPPHAVLGASGASDHTHKSVCICRSRLDEHIEIFSQARFGVSRHGVTAEQHEPHLPFDQVTTTRSSRDSARSSPNHVLRRRSTPEPRAIT